MLFKFLRLLTSMGHNPLKLDSIYIIIKKERKKSIAQLKKYMAFDLILFDSWCYYVESTM